MSLLLLPAYTGFCSGTFKLPPSFCVEPGRQMHFGHFEAKNYTCHGVKHIQTFVHRETVMAEIYA